MVSMAVEGEGLREAAVAAALHRAVQALVAWLGRGEPQDQEARWERAECPQPPGVRSLREAYRDRADERRVAQPPVLAVHQMAVQAVEFRPPVVPVAGEPPACQPGRPVCNKEAAAAEPTHRAYKEFALPTARTTRSAYLAVASSGRRRAFARSLVFAAVREVEALSCRQE